MKKCKSLFVAIILLLIVGAESAIAQCAMCKGAVETNMSTGRNVIGNGINAGIAYLFIFPYLTVGVIAYLWYRSSRKEMAQRVALREQLRNALNG
ncbi:hypothetical protein [Runella sp.]|uniref:hypothetical protein n=1 Tax=Runella sp. TaxID=1960881 RepID=UPI003D0CB685